MTRVKPIQSINLRKALELKKKEEGDLEALALVKDYLFVLGSHSRDRDGKKTEGAQEIIGTPVYDRKVVYSISSLWAMFMKI